MINEIREIIKKDKRTFKIEELAKKLKYPIEKLIEDLKVLEAYGEVILNTDKDIVAAFPINSDYAVGVIHINKKGHGFLDYKNKKFEIPSGSLAAAMSGDTVLIKAYSYIDEEHHLAVVKKVIKRKTNLINCEYDGEKLIPIGHSLSYPLELSSKDIKKLVKGSIVSVLIDDNETIHGTISATIDEILGHKDDPTVELKMIAVNNGIPLEFSKSAEEEAYSLPTEVTEEDLIDREDFTMDDTVTIDCDTTKDMDDAVYVRKLPNGNYELSVHIAHISHYIKPGMALWDEAVYRGNSTYYEDIVLPMLPHIISNGIGSLNPDELRLTRSIIMEIDKVGNILEYRLTKGVIRSRKKMQYSKVNDILEKGTIPEGYEEYADNIKLMGELSDILSKKSFERGIIDFGDTEVNADFEEKKVIGFRRPQQGKAEKLIENFMIAANMCNAEFCKWNEIPTIYRIHELPNSDVIISTIAYLNLMGYRIHNIKSVNNPIAIQGILKSLEKLEEFPIISEIILKAMKRAEYSPQNLGHFGLALEDYMHSTSPIRRLSDLGMQHSLDLWEEAMNNNVELDFSSLEELSEELSKIASMTERRSDAAEEECKMMRMAEFMEDHIGEEFIATVADVKPYGILVKCDNEVKGKVNFKDIMGDNYFYDPEKCAVYGKKTKETLKIGNKVKVTVLSASKEYRTVYFKIDEKLLSKDKVLVLKKDTNV